MILIKKHVQINCVNSDNIIEKYSLIYCIVNNIDIGIKMSAMIILFVQVMSFYIYIYSLNISHPALCGLLILIKSFT